MATESLGNMDVTGAWSNVVTTYASAANADVAIQNLDDDTVSVFFGGASAPSGKSGTVLDTYDSAIGNAANIWVRGAGTVSVTKL